jgi:hypothetical protein
MNEPRWTVLTERRRLRLRRGRPRLERAVLTEQRNAVDVGAWLDEYHEQARRGGRFVPYVILEQVADGITPLTLTDPTSLIHFAREALAPPAPFRLAGGA